MLKRIVATTVFVLLMCGFAAAALDYVLFVYHQRSGIALDTVPVREYLATPLKNGRDELDYIGEIDQPCVRSLLPHQKMSPCWWVRRHKDHWTQS